MRTKSLAAGRDSPIFGRIISLTGGGKYFFDIASLSPTSIPAGSPDTVVSILGGVFNGQSVPYLNGVAAVTYSLFSSGQIDVTIPAALLVNPGSISIQVRDAVLPGTKFSGIVQFGVAYPVPTFTNHSPAFAYLGTGATAVAVTGTGFYSTGTYATLNGITVPFTYSTATTGTVTVPAGYVNDADAYSMAIVNPVPGGGSSATRTFNVRYRTPAITSKSTSIIPINSGNFVVTLNDSGNGYYDPSAWPDGGSTAFVDGTPVSLSYVNAGQVQITIPSTITSVAGVKSITVVNPTVGGGGGSSPGSSITVSAPTTTALSFATRVQNFDPFTLRVSGTNLSSTDTVRYRGVALTTTFVNSTTLDAVMSATALGTAGAGDVDVITATGYVTNTQTFTVLAWSFSDLGSTLRGYFPGTTLVNDGTGRASAWNESLGSGRNLPSVINADIIASASSLNNKPAAYFNGTRGDYMEYTPGWVVSGSDGFVTKSAYTVFAAGAALISSQIGSDPTILGDPGPLINIGNLQANAIRASDNGGNAQASFVWSAGAPFVFRSRKFGGNVYASVNRGAESSAAASAVYSPTSVLVGRGRSGTWKYTGYVGALLFCDSNINATHQAQVWNRLAFDYGSPFGTVTGTITPTSCSPSGATQYDVPFEITVTCAGGGLVAGNVVNIDGIVLASTVDSSTSIRAMLTTASLLASGTKGITISNDNGIGPPLAFVIAPFVPGAGPNLTSTSPTASTQCDDGFPLTCNGSNFTPSSVVYSGATPLATTFYSTALLVAQMPASILYASGNKSITVVDPAGTSGAQVITHTSWTLNSVPEVTSWFEGDNVNTSGSNVTQINDKTGNSRNAVQGTGTKQALLNASDPNFNNAPSIDYDGTNDDHVMTGVNITTLFTNAAWAFAAVYRADAITGSSGTTTPYANNNIASLSSTGFWGVALRTGPLMYAYTNDGAYKVVQNSAAAVTTTQYVLARRAGGTNYCSINNGPEQSLAAGNAGWSSQNLSIASGLGGNYLNGQLAFMATFNATPSAANLTRIKNYTQIKFGWI